MSHVYQNAGYMRARGGLAEKNKNEGAVNHPTATGRLIKKT